MAGPYLPLCAMTVLPKSSHIPRPKVAMDMQKQMMAVRGVSRVLRLQLGQHDLIACFHLHDRCAALWISKPVTLCPF